MAKLAFQNWATKKFTMQKKFPNYVQSFANYKLNPQRIAKGF